MVGYFFFTFLALAGLFVLFLVLTRTMNGIVNTLARIEYYLTKEFEYQIELQEVKGLLQLEELQKKQQETAAKEKPAAAKPARPHF
jgi:hypothetical protein